MFTKVFRELRSSHKLREIDGYGASGNVIPLPLYLGLMHGAGSKSAAWAREGLSENLQIERSTSLAFPPVLKV